MGRIGAVTLAAGAALAVACSGSTTTPSSSSSHAAPRAIDAGAAGAAQDVFVRESFQDLYPIFLRRRSMPLGEKAKLWNDRYLGRWIKWTGSIRSFTSNGITVKQLPSTITFDVSLWMETNQLQPLHKRYHRGDSITYLGRLESYDDIFRTMYLGHGLVSAPSPPDGGAP